MEEWTIAELVAAAAAVLEHPDVTGPDTSREAPNERAVRWYATIGLLDPPLSRRGRRARYGRRHLLQLVAVRRRQADGHSLADIQAELVGATDAHLERIAALPGELAHPDARTERPVAAETTAFWRTRPEEPAPPAGRAAGPTGVRLAPGLSLGFEDPATTITADDAAALRAAAAPLLEVARQRGLVSPRNGPPHRKGARP